VNQSVEFQPVFSPMIQADRPVEKAHSSMSI